jgi:hypothetical protein
MALDGPQLGSDVAHQLGHEGAAIVIRAYLKQWQSTYQFQCCAQGLGVWQNVHWQAVSAVEGVLQDQLTVSYFCSDPMSWIVMYIPLQNRRYL